ncbi:MAG TPA: PTS sugar transporter subunit IIA [Planctomycetota bacterium]|nr:PTS sugar transporter subunit IIA [Planctomycetota bacterium]
MLLSNILTPGDICLNLKSTRKMDAIKEMVDRIAENGRIVDRVQLFDAIVEREELQTTALNSGAAVPHARIDAALPHAKTDAVSSIIMGLGISQQGIDFGAADHTPAHLVFLIAAPKNASAEYLQLLQAVCKLLQAKGFREKMLLAQSPGDVLSAINESEKDLVL